MINSVFFLVFVALCSRDHSRRTLLSSSMRKSMMLLAAEQGGGGGVRGWAGIQKGRVRKPFFSEKKKKTRASVEGGEGEWGGGNLCALLRCVVRMRLSQSSSTCKHGTAQEMPCSTPTNAIRAYTNNCIQNKLIPVSSPSTLPKPQ